MRTIKARRLTLEEVANLGPDDGFLAGAPSYRKDSRVLVESTLRGALSKSEVAAITTHLDQEDGEMTSLPTVLVRTRFGIKYAVKANALFVEDKAGEADMLLLERVGTQVSMTMYLPGMDGPDVLERTHKALRAEFGIGVVQLRQEFHRDVCEDGLPTVLGLPEGRLPRAL